MHDSARDSFKYYRDNDTKNNVMLIITQLQALNFIEKYEVIIF